MLSSVNQSNQYEILNNALVWFWDVKFNFTADLTGTRNRSEIIK